MSTSTADFRILRQQTGLSVKKVADLVGKTESTIYRWERGVVQPHPLVLNYLYNLIDSKQPTINGQHSFTFIDLFAGIGGTRKAFESIGGKCIYTCEWNKFSRETYLENFPSDAEHIFADDITTVHAESIPPHDLLVAGFPCQPFSIAGVSKKNSLGQAHGFQCQTQGTLFFDVERILCYHEPPAFLLENVKNLERHDRGNTFRVIRETLEGLGYTIDFRVIDAKGFVPQHRERIFIVGFKQDKGFTFEDMVLPPIADGPRIQSILHTEDGTEAPEDPYTVGPQARVASKYTLTPHLWTYLKNYAAKHKAKGNGFGFGLCGPEDVARTLSARYYKDGSEILIRQKKKRPRRLTPRECARLMGFDREGDELFKIPVSDTQAYKQFGNSVVVPVVEAVARHMKPYILSSVKKEKSLQIKMALPV